MYAIIRSGSKQYRVKKDDVIDVELLSQEGSTDVSFEDVLLVCTDKGVKVGNPTVAGAKVKGKFVCEAKGEKLIVYKYKRRKNCRVKNGHRQRYSRVQITEIEGV